MAAPSAHDYYAVLGVSKDADAKEIKNAFRKLTMKYHPDRSKESHAAERFKEIAAAYAILGDAEKRAAYDARGRAAEEYTAEDLFRNVDFGDWLGGSGIGSDWVERFFGGGGHFFGRGLDVEAHLTVPLERIQTGGDEKVTFVRPASCPGCGGTGYPSAPARPGTRGKADKLRCRTCRGGGRIDVEDTVVLHLQAGTEEGTVFHIRERGAPAPGARPGDLRVVVTSKPDPRFVRRGANLLTHVTVGVADAALGAEVNVPSLTGTLHVTIPPGTQPGTLLRLRHEGLPHVGTRRRGDVLVRVDVRIPERLSNEARRAFETLRSGPS